MSESQHPATQGHHGRARATAEPRWRRRCGPARRGSPTGLDDANRRATATRAGEFYSRYANPTVRSFEEAIAELEGAEDALAFASRHGRHRHGRSSPCARAATTSSPSASCTPARWRSCRARASASGIDVTFVDGTEPGAFAAAVRPGRTMLVLAETPSNPRLELVDLDELGAIARPDHGRRLDVRHAARPAAAGPRRRPLAALGHQGHRRPQRRHPRRDRRRARADRRDLGVLGAARRQRRRRTTRSTPSAASARWPCAPATRRPRPLHSPRPSSTSPAVAAVHYPGLAVASAVRSGQAADAQRRHGAGHRGGRRSRCRGDGSSTRCSSPASPRRSAAPRRSCAIRRPRPTPASPGGGGSDGRQRRVAAHLGRSRRHGRPGELTSPTPCLRDGPA